MTAIKVRFNPFNLSALRLLLIAAFAILASGCDKAGPNAESSTNSNNPASLQPADPDLAQTYLQSCFACHSRSMSGAPVTGDKAAWASRMAKGMDTLVKNAINGYRGMPPLGGCMDCDREEFAALINFMAGEPAASKPQEPDAAANSSTETARLLGPDSTLVPQ